MKVVALFLLLSFFSVFAAVDPTSQCGKFLNSLPRADIAKKFQWGDEDSFCTAEWVGDNGLDERMKSKNSIGGFVSGLLSSLDHKPHFCFIASSVIRKRFDRISHPTSDIELVIPKSKLDTIQVERIHYEHEKGEIHFSVYSLGHKVQTTFVINEMSPNFISGHFAHGKFDGLYLRILIFDRTLARSEFGIPILDNENFVTVRGDFRNYRKTIGPFKAQTLPFAIKNIAVSVISALRQYDWRDFKIQ